MIHLVTYASENMSKSADLCIHSAKMMGVDYLSNWTPERVKKGNFYNDNFKTLKKERGNGYWLWKPRIILSAMQGMGMDDNDILIYSDAGIEFIAPVQEIINRMDEDIFFFTNGWNHFEWCKNDVMESINSKEKRNEDYLSIKQIQASVIFFRVNQKTKDFVKEWLLYCQMPGFIDDSPSKLPNYPTFAEHRHDQAVLTCLAIKHGYSINRWWPTQYSYHLPRSERDSYPVMFNHHRKRNNEW